MHTIQDYILSSSTGELCPSLQRKRSGCFQCLKEKFNGTRLVLILIKKEHFFPQIFLVFRMSKRLKKRQFRKLSVNCLSKVSKKREMKDLLSEMFQEFQKI